MIRLKIWVIGTLACVLVAAPVAGAAAPVAGPSAAAPEPNSVGDATAAVTGRTNNWTHPQIITSPPGGSRAPFYVQNDTGSNLAGQDLGCQVWIGNNPTATPAANNAIACTFAIDNLSGRRETWALNLVCNQLAADRGGALGINHCQENNVTQSFPAVTPVDPLGGSGAVSHAFEAVASQNTSGTVFNPQIAYWAWSADPAGAADSWNFGYVATRVRHGGFAVEDYDGDSSYGFDVCAFCDYSRQSERVLFVSGGHHNNYIDISGVSAIAGSIFIHAPSGFDTNLFNSNLGDHTFGLTVDSGASASQNAFVALSDRGVEKWRLLKDMSNNFDLTSSESGLRVLQVTPTGTATFAGGGVSITGGLSVGTAGRVPCNGCGDFAKAVQVDGVTAVAASFTRTTPTTVSGLAEADPSPVDGDSAFVTDAANCQFNLGVAGGGSVHCRVHFDSSSSSWKAG
jgi:hypothetical protein